MKPNGLPIFSLLLVCSLETSLGMESDIVPSETDSDGIPSETGSTGYNFRPMPDFDKNQFLGLWYAVEAAMEPIECLVYEFTNTKKENYASGSQTGVRRDHDDPVAYLNHYYGELRVNSEFPANMSVSSPVFDEDLELSFTVFATDYLNFAGIHVRQKTCDGYLHSVTILSRTQRLDEIHLKKVKKLILSAGLDLRALVEVDHSGCKHAYEEFSASGVDRNVVDGDESFYYRVTVQSSFEWIGQPKWIL